MSPALKLRERWVLGLAAAVGAALAVIGIRFFTVPHHAARFFGLGDPPGPFDLHYVVALRDLWIAGLLIGLALLREWRAIGLTLFLGAGVCLGDAWIAASSSGRASAVAFHSASAIYCAGIGLLAWRQATRAPSDG